MPQTDAGYIVRKVLAEPTVYNAVADRIGLLPHPDATTQFYLRIAEAKAAASAVETAVKFQWAPGIDGPPPLITRELVLPIADSLITALQLAQPIIRDAKSGPQFERWVNLAIAWQPPNKRSPKLSHLKPLLRNSGQFATAGKQFVR